MANSLQEEALVLLRASNKSNYQIAKDTGISEATIGNYVNGKTRPTPANTKILIRYFTGVGDTLKSPEGPKTAYLTDDPGVPGVSMSREVFDQIKSLVSTVAAQQSERSDLLELVKSQQRTIETLSQKGAAGGANGAAKTGE